MNNLLKKKKVDPADNKQSFTEVNLNVHCCRYWLCTEWELENLAFPFWRIYHNTTKGAKILYKGSITELKTGKILVIPPNTAFSSFLTTRDLDIQKENVLGRKIEVIEDLNSCKEFECVDHLFIHFNLGLPFDFAKPGIYEIETDSILENTLTVLKEYCIKNENIFSFKETLHVRLFILTAISRLSESLWLHNELDPRVMEILQYIRNNIHNQLSNESLARKANMAVNSFARLFKENIGESLQQYVLKSKIEMACNLLHHSRKSIEDISLDCGFCDRHHFSKIFKSIMGISPGYYKKHITLQ